MNLEDNYEKAKNRLISLERKLAHNPSQAKAYQEAINKYVEDGIAEKVPDDEIVPSDNRPVFHLPHHAVVRKDKQTTKTRIVFDASAKTNGLSLNNCIEAGPSLQRDIVGILLRFRKNRIAMVGDIEKMFLQIALKKEDKDTNEKAYICLFTCAVMRGIHLELVSNMTVERFLLALRRMVGRRGMCKIIWSDNAKTFKGTSKELSKCWRAQPRIFADDTNITVSADNLNDLRTILNKALSDLSV
jgi:hypothetical protein